MQDIAKFIEWLIEWAQTAPTLSYFIITLVIISVTLSISIINNFGIRYFFYLILAASILYFSFNQQNLPHDFILNLGTELVGAILVAILLNRYLQDMPIAWVIIVALALGSTLLIDGTDSLIQSATINLSTEFIGALIVAVLITRRGWLWSYARRELRTFEDEVYAAEEFRLETQKIEIREQIVAQIDAQLDGWKASHNKWDIAVIISATNTSELEQKRSLVNELLSNKDILKEEYDSLGASCYIVGTIKVLSGEQSPKL